jgi:hypothetical protein
VSDYVCEMCSEDAQFVFASLDTVLSAGCEEHRQPVSQRLVELAFEPAAAGQSWADLAEVRIENYFDGMTIPTYQDSPEDLRDVPWGGPR